MKGLIQRWVARQQEKAEQRATEARNSERRALCVEYANVEERREAIIARLKELSYTASLEAAALRIDAASFGMREPQADIIRCTFPRDGFDTQPGQWNKPVEVKV